MSTATEPERRMRGQRGRPPIDGQAARARVWLRLTPRQRAELDQVAAAAGVTMTEVLREAVNEYVADFLERPRPFLSAHKSEARLS